MDYYELALQRLIELQVRKAAELRKQNELTQGNADSSNVETTHVAEQMKARPTGMQRGPSPGGPNITYVNPMAFKPPPDPPQPESQAAETPKMSLAEAAQQRLKEAQAAKTLKPKELETSRPILRFDQEIKR